MSSFTGAAIGSSAAAQYNSVFSPDQLASMWANLQGQLKDSATKNLILQGAFYRSLDQGAKAYIAHKLMNEIGEPVLFALDGNGVDWCYLGAPRLLNVGAGMLVNFTGAPEAIWVTRPEQVKAHEGKGSAPAKIPRPPNAYILYRKERHHLVKKLNPGITNNEISQVLGQCWNMETREVRAQYKSMADAIKKDHREKHPDYQYKPRRPSEKRRRNTNSAGANHHAPAPAPQFNLPELGAVGTAA